ncbi:MAG: hypothetical protein Q4B42_03040 [Oscillospiraceae bacterium]|nr:hypothetical protein [Oscillospiraceae bacterium]
MSEKPKMNEKLKEFLDMMREDSELHEAMMKCESVEDEYKLASKKVSGFTLEEYTEMKAHMKEGPGGPGGHGHRPPPPDGKKPPKGEKPEEPAEEQNAEE